MLKNAAVARELKQSTVIDEGYSFWGMHLCLLLGPSALRTMCTDHLEHGAGAADGGAHQRPTLDFRTPKECHKLGFRVYLEGQGDLVSRLITPITHIVTLNISIINLLIKSP